MTKHYVLFFLIVLTVPFFFGVNAWQSNECGMIWNDIRKLEKNQENYIKDNKTIVNEIVDLLAIERLETEARRMGFKKMKPEDTILIIMGGGKDRGR